MTPNVSYFISLNKQFAVRCTYDLARESATRSCGERPPGVTRPEPRVSLLFAESILYHRNMLRTWLVDEQLGLLGPGLFFLTNTTEQELRVRCIDSRRPLGCWSGCAAGQQSLNRSRIPFPLPNQPKCERQENPQSSSALLGFSRRRRSMVAFTKYPHARGVVTMVRPSTVAKVIDDRSPGSAHAQSQPTTAPAVASTGPLPVACTARGVLDGAFAVLEALADTDDGLGLSALAGASGLAKTSAHRLA
jgi:hypothetical protein